MEAKVINKKELEAQTKQLTLLFEMKGVNYNNWLYEIQQEKLNENVETLINSLKQEQKEKEKLQNKISQMEKEKEEVRNQEDEQEQDNKESLAQDHQENHENQEDEQEQENVSVTGNPMIDRRNTNKK